jgi:hypothetical protein
MQERFRLATYYHTDLTFQASGAEPLAWGEFLERYTAMYPRGQQGLPDDPMTAYVDALRASYTALGSATAWRVPQATVHDFTRECFICMASGSSSSTDAESAPRHRATDAQRRARLDEIAEAKRQLDEELATSTKSSGRTGRVTRKLTCGNYRCRSNTAKETASGRSVDPPQSSPEPVLRHRWLEDVRTTTTDAPTRARTLTATPHRSSGGHRRT